MVFQQVPEEKGPDAMRQVLLLMSVPLQEHVSPGE